MHWRVNTPGGPQRQNSDRGTVGMQRGGAGSGVAAAGAAQLQLEIRTQRQGEHPA